MRKRSSHVGDIVPIRSGQYEKSGRNDRNEMPKRKTDEPEAENGWDKLLLRSG